jgi:hypothetical protein
MRFLFSIDEDVIWFDPAIGRKNHRAVAKTVFGLHSFGEIDLPVHVGYLISVSPTVLQHVNYNKIKELAEREGFEPPIPVKVYTLSRRAPSATRPSLRDGFRYILTGRHFRLTSLARVLTLTGSSWKARDLFLYASCTLEKPNSLKIQTEDHIEAHSEKISIRTQHFFYDRTGRNSRIPGATS